MEKETDIRHFRLRPRTWRGGKSNSLRWELQSKAQWNGNAADKAFTSAIRMEICWNWRRPDFGRPTDGGFFYSIALKPGLRCDRLFSCQLGNPITKSLTRFGWAGQSRSLAF